MTVLLLEPHHDDAALFAAFTCLRFKPFVVTVLASHLQEERGYGITNATRSEENRQALKILGCDNEQWPYPDNNPPWDVILARVDELDAALRPETVFAPAVEQDGHDQHNNVGMVADKVFGHRVRPYLTYRRTHGKTVGVEVVPEPDWIVQKHWALACYHSQIKEPTTRQWFLDDLREYEPAP